MHVYVYYILTERERSIKSRDRETERDKKTTTQDINMYTYITEGVEKYRSTTKKHLVLHPKTFFSLHIKKDPWNKQLQSTA